MPTRSPIALRTPEASGQRYADSVFEDLGWRRLSEAIEHGDFETDALSSALETAKSWRVPAGAKRTAFMEVFVRAALDRAHELAVSDDENENADGSPAVQDDDYTIVVTGRLGSQLAVNQNGRRLTIVSDMADALEFIRSRMEREQFWPNVWSENDHGNVDLLDATTGRVIRSWV